MRGMGTMSSVQNRGAEEGALHSGQARGSEVKVPKIESHSCAFQSESHCVPPCGLDEVPKGF